MGDTEDKSLAAKAEETVSPPRRGCADIFFCLMVIVAAVWGALLGAFVWLLEDAKAKIAVLDEFRPKIGSKVYSDDGELLGEFSIESRQLVSLSEMPLHLQKAFLATEDDTFYEHKGVRVDAIVNALIYILRTGNIRGGSTITQQLVRDIDAERLVGKERTLQRKMREALVALQTERQYTKDEILELYLNQIFLGGSAYGVEAAAQKYFGKHCPELTLGESALLAGLTRSPNLLRPDRHPQKARERRDIVLGQMRDNQFITAEEFQAARAEPTEEAVVTPERRAQMVVDGESSSGPAEFKAPYFVEEVRRYVLSKVATKEEVFEGGLEIHTTLDLRLQRAAEEMLLPALEDFDAKKREYLKRRGREEEFVPVSGALVCLDNRPGLEGYIRAMVGGRDFTKEQYNTATQAKRQPGSSVKPFVWAAAIHNGRTPSDIEVDEPVVRIDGAGNVWPPKNFSGEFEGPMTLRHALEMSVNIISIKLVEWLTMPVVASYMIRAGMCRNIDSVVGLTIALGTHTVTVLDHCVAYSTFVHGGVRCDPVFIIEIKSRDGFPLRTGTPKKTPGAFPPDVAYVVTHLLEGVCDPDYKSEYFPTGWRTKDLDRPRAGKTGTSNQSRNVWFCGFTPDLSCVVWMGYRDNRPLGEGKEYTGGRLACPIWTEFMVRAHEILNLHPRDFEVPDGVEFYYVDRQTGVLGGTYKEAFRKGTYPPTEWLGGKPEHELEELRESEWLEKL